MDFKNKQSSQSGFQGIFVKDFLGIFSKDKFEFFANIFWPQKLIFKIFWRDCGFLNNISARILFSKDKFEFFSNIFWMLRKTLKIDFLRFFGRIVDF